MTGSLGHLALAALAFIAGHVAISSTALRPALIGRLGERPYLGAYSLLQILLFAWLVMAYRAAPTFAVWDLGAAARGLALVVMWFAFVLFTASFSRNAPAVAGAPEGAITRPPVGMFTITRHPMLWAFGLWGLVHMAANGDAASLILFGALALLALGGTVLIDRRKRRELGGLWQRYAEQGSNLPFLAVLQGRANLSLREIGWWPFVGGTALYLVVLFGHGALIGVSPLP